jgi:hypothetical protein
MDGLGEKMSDRKNEEKKGKGKGKGKEQQTMKSISTGHKTLGMSLSCSEVRVAAL